MILFHIGLSKYEAKLLAQLTTSIDGFTIKNVYDVLEFTVLRLDIFQFNFKPHKIICHIMYALIALFVVKQNIFKHFKLKKSWSQITIPTILFRKRLGAIYSFIDQLIIGLNYLQSSILNSRNKYLTLC